MPPVGLDRVSEVSLSPRLMPASCHCFAHPVPVAGQPVPLEKPLLLCGSGFAHSPEYGGAEDHQRSEAGSHEGRSCRVSRPSPLHRHASPRRARGNRCRGQGQLRATVTNDPVAARDRWRGKPRIDRGDFAWRSQLRRRARESQDRLGRLLAVRRGSGIPRSDGATPRS